MEAAPVADLIKVSIIPLYSVVHFERCVCSLQSAVGGRHPLFSQNLVTLQTIDGQFVGINDKGVHADRVTAQHTDYRPRLHNLILEAKQPGLLKHAGEASLPSILDDFADFGAGLHPQKRSPIIRRCRAKLRNNLG